MGSRPLATQGSACAFGAHVPRDLVGKWGMDYQAKRHPTRNTVFAAANGGRGR